MDTNRLRHAIRLTTSTNAAVETVVERAVLAEDAGWDGVFVSDSLYFGFAEPWSVLAAVAARTERLTLGTWVVPVPQLQPWRVAHAVATLDRLSGGRVILGAGLGTRPEYEALGEHYDRAALGRRYDEALEIITGLWRGKPFSFRGEHYTLTDVTLPVTPVQQPRVPVVTAGWWPNRKALRRAAAWDGVMPCWPAMLGDEQGPEGQQPTGATHEEELRALVDTYLSAADEPGELVLPRIESEGPAYDALCADLGTTWMLTTRDLSASEVRAGPPR